MQFNTATILAVAALSSTALAQYNSYSYGSDIYAREAEPEYEDYSLFAREDYLDSQYEGLARRGDDKQADAAKEREAAKKDGQKATVLGAKAKELQVKFEKVLAHLKAIKAEIANLKEEERKELKSKHEHVKNFLKDLQLRDLSDEDLYYYGNGY